MNALAFCFSNQRGTDILIIDHFFLSYIEKK